VELIVTVEERQRQFEEAIRRYYGVSDRRALRVGLGVSNSAMVVEGGLQIGPLNFENYKPSPTGQLILASMIRFPPEDEVYFAFQIKSDLHLLGVRLNVMTDAGRAQREAQSGREQTSLLENEEDSAPESDIASSSSSTSEVVKYSHRNNVVAFYLAHDGRLYLRNKGFWDSLNIDLATVGPGIKIDSIVVAQYPPEASARRVITAQAFIGYLSSMVGRTQIEELLVWPSTSSLKPEMRRLPQHLSINEIRDSINRLGGYFVDDLVERYHAALNYNPRKRFVILSGLSGTGKTKLAVLYAHAVHGLSPHSGDDPLLFICAVRPEWTDPSGLTGYYDVLTQRYVVPDFLQAMLIARSNPDSPVFVVLDELNLARVEYYLSDVLSAIETGAPLRLHSDSVPLKGSRGEEIPPQVELPPNLYITGTINIDESTNPISDKILDRTMLVDMSKVDLQGYLKDLRDREPQLGSSIDQCMDRLVKIFNLLAGENLGFGYRVTEEFVRYHYFSVASMQRNSDQIIDELLVQKILPKLRGSERQQNMLLSLAKLVEDLPRSYAFVQGLQDQLNEMGSFQASR